MIKPSYQAPGLNIAPVAAAAIHEARKVKNKLQSIAAPLGL